MGERIHDAAFWRTTAALCLVLATSSFMNISAFPLFDHVFTYARDISVLANAACLVVVALVASFRSSLLNSHIVNIAALVILVFGSTGIAVSFATQSSWLLVLSSCLVAAARGWVSVVVGVSLCVFPFPILPKASPGFSWQLRVCLCGLAFCPQALACWLFS